MFSSKEGKVSYAFPGCANFGKIKRFLKGPEGVLMASDVGCVLTILLWKQMCFHSSHDDTVSLHSPQHNDKSCPVLPLLWKKEQLFQSGSTNPQTPTSGLTTPAAESRVTVFAAPWLAMR